MAPLLVLSTNGLSSSAVGVFGLRRMDLRLDMIPIASARVLNDSQAPLLQPRRHQGIAGLPFVGIAIGVCLATVLAGTGSTVYR
jgi:hypothetical protein